MASDESDESLPATPSMSRTGSENQPIPATQDGRVEVSNDSIPSSNAQPQPDDRQQPPQIRENMIATAVKFLQNPQVQNSPLSQRRAFLKKKGLSDEEIELSIKRSGVTEPVGSPPVAVRNGNVPVPPQAAPMHRPPPPPRSLYSRARDYTAIAVIISGVTYGVYRFFQKFILPYFKRQDDTERHLQNIEASVASTAEEIQRFVNLFQTSLEKQEAQLEQLSRDVALSKTLSSGRGDSDILQIKQEITSLKGILLSRNQFAATPQQSSIPAWQRKSSTGTQESQSENGIENGPTGSRDELSKASEDPEDEEGSPKETKVLQLKKSMLENGVHEVGTSMVRGLGGEQNGESPDQKMGGVQNGVGGEKEAD